MRNHETEDPSANRQTSRHEPMIVYLSMGRLRGHLGLRKRLVRHGYRHWHGMAAPCVDDNRNKWETKCRVWRQPDTTILAGH